MKNVLVVLIIIAAIFPFAATAIELTKDITAAAVLGGLTVVAIAVTTAAIMYKPKRSADIDTPKQEIPTLKGAPAQREGTPKTAAAQPASGTKAPGNKASASGKADPKRQRAR